MVDITEMIRHNNKDESHRLYVEQKMPNAKGHLLCAFIYGNE